LHFSGLFNRFLITSFFANKIVVTKKLIFNGSLGGFDTGSQQIILLEITLPKI